MAKSKTNPVMPASGPAEQINSVQLTEEEIAALHTEATASQTDQILELDGLDPEFISPPTLTVDVVCFETNTIIHIGSANTQEMAIAMANEHDLQPGQMIRVTPMVYFRVNHGE